MDHKKFGRDGIEFYMQRYWNLVQENRPIRSFPQNKNRRSNVKDRKMIETRNGTPQPVSGRKHTDVQTELFLEELYDVIEADDVCCQTDAFLDRPPTPLFVPAKTGVDAETQILPNDLFDFDMEVKPILEVLVGKVMEQAVLEVSEEEELANIREQQLQLEEVREADLLEVQRLEERERRYRKEKERRIAQHREFQVQKEDLVSKISARTFAKVYVEPLVPTVYEYLYDQGYFYDVIEHNIESNFLPWLMESVCKELEFEKQARALLDTMIREVVTDIKQSCGNSTEHSTEDSHEEIGENVEKTNDSKSENA
uniref:Radial spoke head 3 n=2 Tax=Mesocestoides corti TaxID=53468 RepID=A0A5K3EGI1_MESCO